MRCHPPWQAQSSGCAALQDSRLTQCQPLYHHFLVQRMELYQDALRHAQVMLELDPCWQVSLEKVIAQHFSWMSPSVAPAVLHPYQQASDI